jgi:hypothetical protein
MFICYSYCKVASRMTAWVSTSIDTSVKEKQGVGGSDVGLVCE